MAERWTVFRNVLLCLAALGGLGGAPTAVAQGSADATNTSTSAATATATAAASAPATATLRAEPRRAPAAIQVPRLQGRLRSRDLGLVINTSDPYSEAVGRHYIQARGLAPEQVLRLVLPVRGSLTRAEFEALQLAIAQHFGASTQALALAWVAPYAVECNAITGALALGFDAELCRQSCAASRPSRYFNTATARPMAELSLRPSMLLAAPSVEQAVALIDRGVAADGSLLLRGRSPVNAMMLTTADPARNVRAAIYPAPMLMRGPGVELQVAPAADFWTYKRVLMALTGSVKVPLAVQPDWVDGALADHLTSTGGDLLGAHGQSTALEWIASGATASHGTVSEPCNHLQKFPHPQVLLLHYLQGSTALEAYWKSVLWPQQSLFIGEPLAAPFARP